jgi:Uma2 family endonuclease
MLLEPFTSLEDYDRWAVLRDDAGHYEVADGVPVMSPSPDNVHQRCLRALFRLLDGLCRDGQEVMVAPWDWVLWQEPRLSIRQPDLVVVTKPQADQSRLMSAPLVAVEILSLTSIERDVVTKRRDYATAGLDHYWIVEPAVPQAAIFRRTGNELKLVVRATESKQITLSEPFDVTFTPADLLA